MVTDVFFGAGMSNTSKQHMISLHNRNETSSHWSNQLITLQRVFSAFQHTWHWVGPLVPRANAHMGRHPSRHLLSSDASATSVIIAWHLQLLGSTPGPWGIRPNSRLGGIMVRLKCVGCLFIWLKRRKNSTVTEQRVQSKPLDLDLFLAPLFHLHIYKAWPMWKIALLLSNPNYREN